VNDHPTSLGMMCGQHVKSSSFSWLSRFELSLQIGSYANYLTMPHWHRFHTLAKNSSPPGNQTSAISHSMSSKRLWAWDRNIIVPLYSMQVLRGDHYEYQVTAV